MTNDETEGPLEADGGRVGDVDTIRRPLVSKSRSRLELAAAGVVAVAVAVMLVGIAVLAKQISATASLLGVSVVRWQGVALVLMGLTILALGGLSRAAVVETYPDRSVGLAVGVGYGLVGVVGGVLVGSQTLGLPPVGWMPVAVVGGAAGFAASVSPREDLGATIPPGILALVCGLAVLAGTPAPGSKWTPTVFSVEVPGSMAVPLLVVVVGLLVIWTAARAYGGFGAYGKQTGAYVLIGANAAWMLGVLVVLIAFVVSRGIGPTFEGARFGLSTRPVSGVSLPFVGGHVAFEVPTVRFAWPFVTNGASPRTDVNGVMPAIVGTVWLVVGAIVFAVPLGVGAAVFLTEYAEQGQFTRVVEVSTTGLWSTPSIVYGLFGLSFLVPRLGNGNSILSGQIVLGSMLLPLVVITSREALKSVPDDYRDASAALGVSKWETTKSVVVPAAMPGVITGIILGVGRIAGETAPILLVTAGAPFPSRGPNVLQSFRMSVGVVGEFPFVYVDVSNPALLQPASALPYQMFAVITAGVNENLEFAWGTALVLLVVVLGFYAVGVASRTYFRKKLRP